MTPERWLLVAVTVYFAVAFSLSWLRAAELQTTTWDQGLYQQALWSTAHGRPFYETADVETGGFHSLLEVHSAIVLYALVPLYAALPYQATMLGVQAAVVALAAVPLFFLARDLTRSPRWALLAAVAFLCWTPTLSSNLYDFHPEAFLPLEIFTLVLLWNRGRFLAAFGVATLAFLTFEFAPLITFALAVWALLPEPRAAGTAAHLRSVRSAILTSMATPRVRAAVVLLAASVLAYAALLQFRTEYLPSVVGTTTLPSAVTGYVIGATPAGLGLSVSNLTVGFWAKLEYWVLILALLAFVPLFAPRALLLTVPWFAFTFLSANLNYVTLGFQYGLIAGSTVLVAFAFALPRIRTVIDRLSTPTPEGLHVPGPPRARGPALRTLVIGGVVLLLAVNVALTPVNPALQNAGMGSAYRIWYQPPPGAPSVEALAAMVPSGATVVASDDLFPLVANNENAYSFSWTADPSLYLPFSASDPPSYVFVAEDRTGAVTPWIAALLYDPAVYGAQGVAWSTLVGTVVLFQRGYSGPPTEFGPVPTSKGVYYGAAIASSPYGIVVPATGETFSATVESAPGSVGTIWYGPGEDLPGGNYSVTVSVRTAPVPGGTAPNGTTPAVWIGAFAFGQPSLYGWSVPYADLASDAFVNVTLAIDLPGPSLAFVVQGQLLVPDVQVTLNYVAIAPG